MSLNKFLISWYEANLRLIGRYGDREKKLWMFRPIATYFGRTKSFVLSKCKRDLLSLDRRIMHIPANEFLHVEINEHRGLETKLMKRFTKKGDNVLILGANIGYWTCFYAQLVGESGKVFAFEPSPSNFQFLKKNVEINKYSNVILEQKAVANKNYKTKLFLSNSTMDHRIYDTKDDRNTIDVDVICLDDYFKNKDVNFNIIKSNIQGSDFSAFFGMQQLFDKTENLKYIIEFDPTMSTQSGFLPCDFLDLMQKKGFNFYELRWYNSKLKKLSMVQLKNFIDKNISTNILCTKGDFSAFLD